jgi:hypothetical protein
MKLKILLCLTLVLSGGLFGCSSEVQHKENSNSNVSGLSKADPVTSPSAPTAYEAVTNAINREDWDFLRGLARKGMRANSYIEYWEKYPVRVGKLINVETDFSLNGKQCTMYSFELSLRDGKAYPHWLQVIVGREGGQTAIVDFWEYGW